jgi:outer membrane protein assembly factor BamB
MKIPHALMLLAFLCAPACGLPQTMWEYRVQGTVSTELVVDGGVVYFGSSSGKVVGLNASTGWLVFNVTLPAPVYSAPAVCGGLVVAACDSGVVYGLNRSTGDSLWSFMAQGPIKAGLVVSDGALYAGSDDGRLYALKPQTGRLIWKIGAGGPVQSAPLAEGWKLYLGSSDKRFQAISNISGGTVWNRTFAGQPKGPPQLLGDLVYVATSDRKITAVDKYSGQTVWNFTFNGSVTGPPAVYDGILYVSAGKSVYAVDGWSGTRLWEAQMNETVQSPPLPSDGDVVYGAGQRLCAVTLPEGQPSWCLNASGTVKSRPAEAGGVLIAAAGSYVRGYGGSADLEVTAVRARPAVPAAGRPFRVEATVRNTGTALAPQATVRFYLDRVNVSSAYVTIPPGGQAVLSANVTASHGRHLAEAVADEDGRLVEADESNNRYGTVFYASSEWPTFRQNVNRTGLFDVGEGYGDAESRLVWSCTPQGNRSMADIQALWEGLDPEGYPRLRELGLNFSCSAQAPRGFKVGRLSSNWTCAAINSTGWSDRNFWAIRDYVSAFNETAYNLSLRRRTDTSPYNVSDFKVSFGCEASSNQELPVINAAVLWDCRARPDIAYTPWNLTQSWACTARYVSNYSMEDLAVLKGYRDSMPPRTATQAGEYSLLWSVRTGGSVESSPVIVDLDGSGDGVLEAVFGSQDGGLYAIGRDGIILWEARVNGSVNSVSADDLDGDGRYELLAGSSDGALYCFSNKGSQTWAYQTGGPVYSAPLALNIDNTPEKEVVFGSWDGRIYALDRLGRHLWDYPTTDGVASTPTATDIDADGALEVAVGSSDNILYVLRTPPYKVWMYQTNGDVSGSPAAVKGRGKAGEIIAASGDGSLYSLYYSVAAASDERRRVCDSQGCSREGVSQSKLTTRWAYSAGGPLESSPAVGDIDGDGRPDILVGSGDKNLYAVNASGGKIFKYTTGGPVRSSPALADLDGDGLLEAVFGSDDGRVYILNSTGQAIWSRQTNGSVRSSPAVADINGDGRLEFAVGSDDGSLYVFGIKAQETARTPAEKEPEQAPPQPEKPAPEAQAAINVSGPQAPASTTVPPAAPVRAEAASHQAGPAKSESSPLDYSSMGVLLFTALAGLLVLLAYVLVKHPGRQ